MISHPLYNLKEEKGGIYYFIPNDENIKTPKTERENENITQQGEEPKKDGVRNKHRFPSFISAKE